jgi:hypothetical protein
MTNIDYLSLTENHSRQKVPVHSIPEGWPQKLAVERLMQQDCLILAGGTWRSSISSCRINRWVPQENAVAQPQDPGEAPERLQ